MIGTNRYQALIEISKGSRMKYEYNTSTNLLTLDRILPISMCYPENYGFIPETLSGDDDPLDIFVLCPEPILPGVIVNVMILGVIHVMDGGDSDDKIIASVVGDDSMSQWMDSADIPNQDIQELKFFLEDYKKMKGSSVVIGEIQGHTEALRVIEDARQRQTRRVDL